MPFAWDAPPRVVAHRGASRDAPENTMVAFRAAVEAGAAAVELDARLARDGEVVVHHDAALGRTAAGSGLVEAHDAAALRRLDAGAWFGEAFRGERVPTLREVLERLPRRTLLDVELKPDGALAEDLPARVAEEVARAGALDRVLATSFDPFLAEAYAERTGRPVGLISPMPVDPEDLRDVPRVRHVALAREAVAAQPGVVRALREAGYLVHAWTVNDAAEAGALWRAGVQAAITDAPALLLQAAPREGAAVQ